MSFFGWLFASQYYASAPIVGYSKISAQPREPGRGDVTNTLITSLIIVQKPLTSGLLTNLSQPQELPVDCGSNQPCR